MTARALCFCMSALTCAAFPTHAGQSPPDSPQAKKIAALVERAGTNVVGGKDANGKLFHDEILETAESKGSGWVDYVFPKPGQTDPSHKWTYVKRITIDGVPGLLGAGFYE